MAAIIDPTSLGFLLAETRSQPMHVAGLQLFEPPEGAGEDFARDLFESALDVTEVAPLFTRRPTMSIGKLGQWVWTEDKQFDIEHHVRHNALPAPGPGPRAARAGQPAARHDARARAAAVGGAHHRGPGRRTRGDVHQGPPRPGRRDLRDAADAERAHAPTPTARHMPLPFDARATTRRARRSREEAEHRLADVPVSALRTAVGLTAEAAGLPAAFIKTLTKGVRNETSALSLHAPRTMFNVKITGSRRFAAQDWPLERIRAISKASGTTLNDVVLAMCSGAVRDLPRRPRPAPGHLTGLDGAGGPEVAPRRVARGRRRQRGRVGDGPAGHAISPTRPTGWSPCTSR